MARMTAVQPSVYGHGGSSLTTPAQPSGYDDGDSSSPTPEPYWVGDLFKCCELSTTLRVTIPIMYTAPENMRLVERDIFKPVLVSIGPFHHGEFTDMDQHKTRILISMLNRHGNMDPRKFLMELVNAAWAVIRDSGGYYPESVRVINFDKMMVFDGCFILEIFRMHIGLYKKEGDQDDPIFMARWMLPVLGLDIIKLENQLPYSILKELYERTKLPGDPTLNSLAGKFLDFLCPGLNKLMKEDDQSQDHLLALFHSTFVHRTKHRSIPINDEGKRLNSFPSVTDLCLSGIKVVKKENCCNLLEIDYKNGKLEIPTLVIDHNTKILMRNLVSYEQCNKKIPNIFTSYLIFMDALVNSAEDVEVLRLAGVIDHFMNSYEEVSELLNSLTANLEFNMNEGYLAGLNARLYNAYYSPWPQIKARFKRLVSSREGIGYVVTVFAFYLAVLQTVFTVLSYFLPK